MKKPIKKKTASSKKATASKKNSKPVKQEKKKDSKKLVYPSWTTPEHLSERDHKDLKRFYELFISGKIISAFSVASNFDTIVREAIPPEIWKQSKGTSAPAGEDKHVSLKQTGSKGTNAPVTNRKPNDGTSTDNKTKTQTGAKKSQISANKNATRPRHIGTKEKLPPVGEDCNTAGNNNGNEIDEVILENTSNNSALIEIKFNSEVELQQLTMISGISFFGEHAVLFKNKHDDGDEYFCDMFLIDFSNKEKPRLYLIETALSGNNFAQHFFRITHLFALLQSKKYLDKLMDKLSEVINSNKKEAKELEQRIRNNSSGLNDFDIREFLTTLLCNHPYVLLITDGEIKELPLFIETYTETWGKMFSRLIIRKYSSEDKEIHRLNPSFSDILKSKKVKPEIFRNTEEDHLKAASEMSAQIYNEIKAALLKVDKSIEFNVKKIYISIRKGKNIAFFHLRKKISLVVMNPEEDTRKQIKHHEIKTLPASVQKFWNGPSCTIIIETMVKLEEVINLLKKMIAKS
jgi:predicted transport protein